MRYAVELRDHDTQHWYTYLDNLRITPAISLLLKTMLDDAAKQGPVVRTQLVEACRVPDNVTTIQIEVCGFGYRIVIDPKYVTERRID